MGKRQCPPCEQGERAHRMVRRVLRKQVEGDVAAARRMQEDVGVNEDVEEVPGPAALQNEENNRIDGNVNMGLEEGEIVGYVQGDAEVLNEVGRRAAHQPIVEPAQGINNPPQPQAQGARNLPPNDNEGPRLVNDNNPYDNEEEISGDDFSDEEEDDNFGNQRLYNGAPIYVRDTLASREELCPTCREEKEKAYFVQLPLLPQLRELYKRPSFYNSLQHRHARVREPGAHYFEDIYDGSVYQEHVQGGFLNDRNNISLTWYTDGAPVFNSRNYSIWPFMFMINELPYKMRTRRENYLMAGLWFGPHKPAVNIFLRSFLPDLRKLFRGVDFTIADLGGNATRVRAMVLAGVCDTPAKSSFFNFNAHNGYYGCTFCEIRGAQVHLPARDDQPQKRKHVYHYQELLSLRSINTYEQLARAAVDSPDPVLGIKGPTALHLFMPDFLKGGAIDPMHLVTGVSRKLLKIHFDSKWSRERYSVRHHMGEADRLLLLIKPPRFIHRRAQSLELLHRWKASQLFAWIYYYSIPIYKQILTPVYFFHYLKFVEAVSLLNSNVVSAAEINRAETLLKEFVRDFEQLYHIKHCSINIHLLLHLPDCVRRLGPLWVYSCFPMENLNGLMLANIHGKTSVDSQLCNSFWKVLCQNRRLHEIPDGELKEFITKRRKSVKIQDRVFQGCYSVGDYSEAVANDQIFVNALREQHGNDGPVSLYFRLLKDRLLYVAERYERDLASKSSYVMYDYRGTICYGMIELFIRTPCHCGEAVCLCVTRHFAVIRQFQIVDYFRIPYYADFPLKHIHRVVQGNNLHVVPVQHLKTVCVYIPVYNQIFLARPLNLHELIE
ncbi:hypothetical protein FOCC_FOCC000933 [Frankliniella occidentalis]|nr:hypothetical protein FOCC_FOCC000933 [Frankliniella occidentalis]